MRGDSLRDFQAKVLAIAGLGVLAGVGALVDYWPTGSNVPPIRAGLMARPEVPVPTPASIAAGREIDAAVPMAVVPLPEKARRARAAAQPAPLASVAVVAAAGALPIGETLALASVDFSPVASSLPSAPAAAAPAQAIELPPPPAPVPVDARSLYVPTFAPTLAPDPEPGFVMGTLRKTGAGIAKTGAVTGASIMDAFRGVAGAFKKVSPFRDRSFIGSN